MSVDEPTTETGVGAGVAVRSRNGPRPSSSARWGSWYVAEHSLRRLKGYGGTVVATAFGTPVLYMIAFGVGLASLVTAHLGPHAINGVSYLTFVAPALLCAAGITVAAEEFTYPIMMGFKWNPVFVGMNSAPLSARQIVNGLVIFVAIRMSVTALIYFAITSLFGAVPFSSGWLSVPVAILTGLAFGAPLMAFSASLTEDRGQFALVMRFVVVPMTLFSGTMFPLTQLPEWLRWIAWISPLWHGTEVARVVSYGADVAPWLIAVHLAVLVVLLVLGWALAVRITRKRLDK
ncbi:ABC transporter permease [Lysinimonas soli]|uniref:Transport permease protein n=1 Tax=Lysinimonas soli TaxID=1074233 RepID=A0ABW0NW16_9MICO